MKILIDDTEVNPRTWYYLLDFNDRDGWKIIMELFDTHRLSELELHQYIQLFEIATNKDLEELNNKLK